MLTINNLSGTYDAFRNGLVKLDYNHGYWVSPFKNFEIKLNAHLLDMALFENAVKYLQSIAKTLSSKNRIEYRVGVWQDGDYVYLDISQHVTNYTDAIKLALANEQLAIWDCEKMRAIILK
jgi:hypothetical protein